MATGLLSTIKPTPTITSPTGQSSLLNTKAISPLTDQKAIASGVATAAADKTALTPAAPATTAQNTPRTIGANETVAGQLNSLINQNSDYMQSARNTALQQANSRGLLNSSLAVGAGQRAAIDAALPIAQQDATINAQAGQSAQDANQTLLQTAKNHEYTTIQNQQNIDANVKLKQMDIDIDTKRLSAQQLNALSSAMGPIQTQYIQGLQQINSIPDEQMNPAAKATAIKNLKDGLRAQLTTLSTLYNMPITWPNDVPNPQPSQKQKPSPNDQNGNGIPDSEEVDRNGG